MSPKLDALLRTLDVAIPEAMERLDIPGAAVGVCDAKGVLWSAGYGMTAKGGGAPVTSATAFSVQSTSKLFTATSALLAVHRSLVDLDDSIRTHVPEFTVNSVFDEDPGATITVRHLLAHTAGFTHEAPVGSNYDLGGGDFEAHCRSIFDTWLRFPVGHHHEYSNLGIDLAAYALERASGVPFVEYARRELLEPLGLERSSFDAAAIEADSDRAIGHWRPFERAGRPLPVAVPMVAAGGLYTSVDDALRFVSLLLRAGEPLLAPGLVAEQLRVQFPLPGQRLGYGLGVYVDEWAPGVRVYHHGGSGFGFQAQLCWAPELDLGAVVLTNSFDQSLPDELVHRIVEHMAGGDRSAPVMRGATDGAAGDLAAAAELVGQYVGRSEQPVRVLVEGDRLLVRGNDTHAARLIGADVIELHGPGAERYLFARGRDGAATYMLALRDGAAHYRNDPARAPSSTLDAAHAGTYVASSWGVPTARYRIVQDGDSPVIERHSGDPAVPGVGLRLSPIEPGLFLSSMGEALDLRGAAPSYANIALTKDDAT